MTNRGSNWNRLWQDPSQPDTASAGSQQGQFNEVVDPRIVAEAGVLLRLIFTFDRALHSLQSARLTWDHAAVRRGYGYVRI